MQRMIMILAMLLSMVTASIAQETVQDADRSATGGAQTLDDILKRQQALDLDDSFRSDALGTPEGAKDTTEQLGTLGGVSDAEFWRSFRYGAIDPSVSSRDPAAGVVIQDTGMAWQEFRAGPLRQIGGNVLLGTLIALALFYMLRGKIKIDGGPAGTTIKRFKAFERFGHWILAGSFVVLGLTGLLVLFGRVWIVPTLGHDANSFILIGSKWVHNNVSWAFMIGVIWVFFAWVLHNIPNRTDLVWLAQGGGIFTKAHPPAKKFNAGQKIIFWLVIVMGVSISMSGLSLLFPFELPMFAKTFALMNEWGISGLLGLGELPSQLSPHREMQLAQSWHTIVAFAYMAFILAHIYIGSVGMEGAFDAMGKGDVDEEWARQHHSLWYEEVTGKPAHHDTAAK